MFDENKEIEVLSSAFYSRDRLEKLSEYPADIFHFDKHQYIIGCLNNLIETNDIVDVKTLTTHLTELGEINKYQDLLTKIVTSNYSQNIVYELNYLKNLYLKRKVNEIAIDYRNSKIDFQQFYDKFNEIYNYITIDDDGRVDFKEYLKDTPIDDIFHEEKYITTGLYPLDRMIRGFFNGQLIVIAARPGKGKSTLAWQFAQKINDGALFFSLEMGRDELYAKSISAVTDIEVDKIESKKMDSVEFAKLMKAHEGFTESMRLVLYDKPKSKSNIINTIRKEHKQRNIRVVFIDYLQLIAGGKGNNPNERIQNITMALKNLARELRIPIVLLSQLNREVEKSKRFPVLSDLRDSGAIEQDADLVLFLHEDDDTYLIISKGRKVNTGKVTDGNGTSLIYFNKKYSRFEDRTEEEQGQF